MSHPPGAASSDRQRASHVLRMLRKATKTDGNPVAPSATNCACAVHCDKVGRRRKRRSLKTRKERSHARGGGCGAADCRPCDQRQRGKGKNPSRNRCRSSAPPLRGGGLLPPMFRFAKEPSIITDGRLVGHHGLFNHEVKSLDVKRHRSEPRERDLPAHRAAQESDVAAGRAQPASRLSSSRPSCGAAVEHADENVLTHKNADPSTCITNTKEVCQESENPVRQSYSQASDMTPGQRSPRRGDVSSDGDDVIALRTRGPPKEMTPKSEKGNSLALERERGSLLTSSGDTENVKPLKKRVKGLFDSHTPEHTPKNQGPPKHPAQPCSPSPNLPQLSSSPIAGTSEGHDAQQQGSGLDCLSNSVGAVAVRLCNSLQLPLLSRRNLVAESRGRLLQAMQKRHGPLLQENLLKVKRRLSFGPGPRAEQDKEQPTFDTDDVWPTETFSTALAISIVGQTYFDTQKAPVKRRKEQCVFGWMSTPQLNTNLNKALEWMMSPVQETGVETDVLDDWLRPGSSSQGRHGRFDSLHQYPVRAEQRWRSCPSA
ncbi:uncharacterized protein si:dkey-250k15.4 isoform X2 [Lampris incognitus]|uniref:uncharacterized protein si:dkey-250k15.4 isoform X2 n=1 Tax=Lampris incognitus TaxID=2546036 RepID=UPI0024B5DCFF|nr:uncharacterized protein si:dkey-250k15.4 isoform X2 [Lampris incognitus]